MKKNVVSFILTFAVIIISLRAQADEPKLLGIMRICPLTELAEKSSKFSSKISKTLTALPFLALAGLSFAPDYQAMDFDSDIKVFLYSVGDKTRRKIDWIAYFEMNPAFEKKKLPSKIKWLKGKKANLRRFKDGILVSGGSELLKRIKKLPPCREIDESLISIEFDSAEYMKNNRGDFEALRKTYLDKSTIGRMSRDFGPVIAKAIIDRIDDLENVMQQSGKTVISLDIENDAILLSIKAKPSANSKLAEFIKAQKNISNPPPPLAAGHTVVLRGNLILTPPLRKAMSGLGKAENFLMPFTGNKSASAKLSPILNKCASGRFSWFVDQNRHIPTVGAIFFKPDLSKSKLKQIQGLKKTVSTDIYHVVDYMAKERRCSVFLNLKQLLQVLPLAVLNQDRLPKY